MFVKHAKVRNIQTNPHTRCRAVPESKPLRSESAKPVAFSRSANPGLEPHTPPVKHTPGGHPHLPQITKYNY